jgi:gamma-glutamyltranspeptidase/glutathione hydrolase
MEGKVMARFRKSTGSRFAVASGCRYATQVAMDVLAQGGNVVDAALAASAVLCVTLPHSVSIGGDLFALVKKCGVDGIAALNATGAAPQRANVTSYRTHGHVIVPLRGPLSIQTPGLVAGWQAMAKHWASWPFGKLLEPAIAFARDGFPIGARFARLSSELAPIYSAQQGWADTYLVGGAPISVGGILKQERLAVALSSIARDNGQSFYRGKIADDIVRSITRAGGLIEREDLERVKPEMMRALTIRVGDLSVATQPPISQGVVLLRALRLVSEHFAKNDVDIRTLWPRAAHALQTAFAERVRVLGDQPNSFELAQAMIDGHFSGAHPQPHFAHSGTETTTISVMDSEGNAVSLILSIFADFGSGIVTDETGILLNNRLSGFFLDDNHPNGLKPGKRTMHTLHSVMVCDGEVPVLTGGSPGGDAQPQVNLQVLCRVLFRQEGIAEAVAEPRWMLFPATAPADVQGGVESTIRCEPELDMESRYAFEQAGFRTTMMLQADIGSAKWVMRDRSGQLIAACDVRRDAAVIAE